MKWVVMERKRKTTKKKPGKRGKPGKQKLKAGIFAFTCCEGCQLQILDLWDRLVQVLDFVEIEYTGRIKEEGLELFSNYSHL